jgi:hypothetical protein
MPSLKPEEAKHFLEYVIQHLENRISMLDNRSSILIGAHGIFFAVFTLFLSKFFYKDSDLITSHVALIVIGIAFILLVLSIFLLLKSIRPTRFPFGIKINPDYLHGVSYEFIWPGKAFTGTPEGYLWSFERLDIDKIISIYQNANFILLGHVKTKMKYYRYAVFSMKIFIAYCLTVFIVLTLIKLINPDSAFFQT